MKKILVLVFVAGLILAFSCKSRKDAPPAENNASIPATTITELQKPEEVISKELDPKSELPEKIILKFTSRGEGINHAVKDEFEKLIKKYNELQNGFLRFNTSRYGREGEIEYCVYFQGDDAGLKQKFLEETEALIKNYPLIFLQKTGECRK